MTMASDLLRRSIDLLSDKKLADLGADQAIEDVQTRLSGGEKQASVNAAADLETFLVRMEKACTGHEEELQKIRDKTGGKVGVVKG